MKWFDYKTVQLAPAAMDFEPSTLEWQLNQLGADGWELAAAIGSCWYIFKREVVA